MNNHLFPQKAASDRQTLLVYTLSHGVVDFTSFVFLFGLFRRQLVLTAPGSPPQILLGLGFLLYNTLAFGSPVLIGFFNDLNPRLQPARIGLLLMLSSTVLATVPSGLTLWLSLMLLAVGNAWFHVAGGLDAVLLDQKNGGRYGIFAAAGAAGVAAGTFFGLSVDAAANRPWLIWLPLALLTASLIAVVVVCPAGTPRVALPAADGRRTAPLVPPHSLIRGAPVFLPLLLILLMIGWQNYIGIGFTAVVTGQPALLMLGIVIGLGKAVGGLLADRFPPAQTLLSALLLSSLLLLILPWFSAALPPLLLLLPAVLLAQFSVGPLTWLALQYLPNAAGFSFGLTKLALLVSSLPSFLFIVRAQPTHVLAAQLAGLALLLGLFIQISRQKRNRSNNHGKEKEVSHVPHQ